MGANHVSPSMGTTIRGMGAGWPSGVTEVVYQDERDSWACREG
jgi:hypothetical protein